MSPDETAETAARVTRRRALAALSAVGQGCLAGCTEVGEDRPTADPTDAPGAARTATETPTRSATSAAADDDPTRSGSTSSADGQTPTAGALDPANYGPPDGGEWTVTLADYFTGDELDADTWSIGIEGHHEGTHCVDAGARSFCWTDEHVRVDPATNRLRLLVSDDPVPRSEREPAGTDAGYTVGAVNTRGAFAQEFGYFEAAVRIPDQPGTLPAFWLFHDKFEYDWREIDVYEKNGRHDADVLKMGAWFERDDDGPEPPDVEYDDNDDRIHVGAGEGTDRIELDGPVDERFQVVGLEWSPTALTWYVNGDVVGRVDHPGVAEYLPGRELFLILNSAVFVGADWLGSPADASFPHAHEVEWVRAWQRDDWA